MALEVAAIRKDRIYEDLRAAHRNNNNMRDWHDDMTVTVIFFDRRQPLWRTGQPTTFCHRHPTHLTNNSDFEGFLAAFDEFYAAAASSSSSSAAAASSSSSAHHLD